MIRKLIFAILGLSLSILAQQAGGTGGVLRPVDEDLFVSCNEVEKAALALTRQFSDRTMQLFPRDRGTLFFPFPSEQHTGAAMNWIASHPLQNFPYALFYSVNAGFKFRCRDNKNQSVETWSPQGDPLELRVPGGKAVVWHFFVTVGNAAHAFVVTDVALNRLGGAELLDQFKQHLGARVVYLYARNDPLFLGYSPDSLPYIFTESFKRMTREEYGRTETMTCFTDQGCSVGRSQD